MRNSVFTWFYCSPQKALIRGEVNTILEKPGHFLGIKMSITQNGTNRRNLVPEEVIDEQDTASPL